MRLSALVEVLLGVLMVFPATAWLHFVLTDETTTTTTLSAAAGPPKTNDRFWPRPPPFKGNRDRRGRGAQKRNEVDPLLQWVTPQSSVLFGQMHESRVDAELSEKYAENYLLKTTFRSLIQTSKKGEVR